MSPTSYQTAPPRVAPHVLAKSRPIQKGGAFDRAAARLVPCHPRDNWSRLIIAR
jgi:hypothetical protein